MADDLVEERLTQIDFAFPQRGLVGLAFVPPELCVAGDQRVYRGLAALILVGQFNGAIEEALRGLATAAQRARTASRTLGDGLQGDRRRVAKGLNRIREITRLLRRVHSQLRRPRSLTRDNRATASQVYQNCIKTPVW